MKGFLEKYKNEEIDRSIESKCTILGLDFNEQINLKNEAYKNIDTSNLQIIPNCEIINNFDASLLVGGSKETYKDWLEALDGTTKMYLFTNRFPNLDKILKEPMNDDFPLVYKYKDEYYIGKDGKHRLTICKCLNKKLKVNLYEYID